MSAARDAANEYDRRQARLIAINPGSLESHQAWAEQFGFQFPIVVDEESKVAAAYGALKETGGIQRCVYIVDRQGLVRYAQQGMPETDELLRRLDELAGSPETPGNGY